MKVASIGQKNRPIIKSYSVWYIAIFIFILHDKFLNNFKTIQQMVAEYIAPARSNIWKTAAKGSIVQKNLKATFKQLKCNRLYMLAYM